MRAAKLRGKKKSLASSAAADLFPVSLPASCGAPTPSGCVHAASPSPLPAIRPKPSLSSQPRPPRRVSRQAPRAGERRSAPSLCAEVSPLCPPHPCGCALLRGSEASPLCHPQSPPAKGLLVCGDLSFFTAPSQRCRSRSYSFLFFLNYYLFIWLCWVFVSVRGLSLVAASRGHSSSRCVGPLTIVASVVAEHRLQMRRLSSCGSRA